MTVFGERALKDALKDNFFSLFGLPARYEVDEVALDAAYRTVTESCNACHKEHAGGEHQLKP